MPAVKRKAFAYITNANRLLVFSHPHSPEAGIQVPAGTMEPGETPEEAVMREAREETGLEGLVLAAFLGEQVRAMSDWRPDEIHHRYFFHLLCEGDPPETWQHYDPFPSDGSEPPLFEFFWAPLPGGVPELIVDHGAMLPVLLSQMGLSPQT